MQRRLISSRSAAAILAAVVGSAAIGCGADAVDAPPSGESPSASPGAEATAGLPSTRKIAQPIVDAIAAGEGRDVIVRLVEPAFARDAAEAPSARVEARALRRAPLAAAVAADLAAAGVQNTRTWRHFPLVRAHVDGAAALAALARDPRVAAVDEDARMTHMLAQSLPLVHQPTAFADGNDGAGTAVAVLDTGVDYRKHAFGSCAAPGGGCKVAYAADMAADDGALDDDGHGSNVAAIVLGVAPAAKVVALDVFDGEYASSSTLLTSIDWVIQHRDEYGIVAINMSLGSGRFSDPCAAYPLSYAIAEARDAGILTAVASGNNASSSTLIYPACAPAAISVGAVYDANVGHADFGKCLDPRTGADQITCFSNSAYYLTLLAPGAFITAADMMYAGTSQATPHVAGAIAVVKSAYPSSTPDQTVARLTGSGKPITDPRNGITTPRLDVAAASCSALVTPSSDDVRAAGGDVTLAIETGPSCPWAARTGADWLSVGPSGRGDGTLVVHVAPNHGPARRGDVTVGRRHITFRQAGAR